MLRRGGIDRSNDYTNLNDAMPLAVMVAAM
jgi:hypothetical protein